MYEVPGSGKHHKRHAHGQRLRFTTSDVRWAVGTALLPPILVVMAFVMPHGLFWVAGILVMALGALTVRLVRHPGDHHFTSAAKSEDGVPGKPEPEPVYDVKIVPTQEEAEAEVRRKVRTLGVLATVSGVALAFAKHSQRQADKSTRMHDEVDELLGIPGKRLGYGVKYHAGRPPVWVQPPLDGWQERDQQQILNGHVRRVGGEPGRTEGSWQNG
jgi:hypothetical protein